MAVNQRLEGEPVPDKHGFYRDLEVTGLPYIPCVACGGPTEARWTHISVVDWGGWLLSGVTCLLTAKLEEAHLVP